MKHYCFVMKIKPEFLTDYIEIHKNAWPELLKAAKESGAKNLLIYIYQNLSIVIFECEDLDNVYENYGKYDVVKEWNEKTESWIEESPKIDGSGSVETLEEVFNLSKQYDQVFNN